MGLGWGRLGDKISEGALTMVEGNIKLGGGPIAETWYRKVLCLRLSVIALQTAIQKPFVFKNKVRDRRNDTCINDIGGGK